MYKTQIKLTTAIFGAFTAMKIQVEVFRIVTPCSDVVGYRRFGRCCCLHLHFILKMEVAWCHNPEHHGLYYLLLTNKETRGVHCELAGNVQEILSLWHPKVHHRYHKMKPLDTYRNHFIQIQTITDYFPKIHFNIILQATSPSLN
jgi:hypothetical protein